MSRRIFSIEKWVIFFLKNIQFHFVSIAYPFFYSFVSGFLVFYYELAHCVLISNFQRNDFCYNKSVNRWGQNHIHEHILFTYFQVFFLLLLPLTKKWSGSFHDTISVYNRQVMTVKDRDVWIEYIDILNIPKHQMT